MATIDNYKINLSVIGQQAVDKLKFSIDGLATSIAGIGFGAFVAGAARLADSFNDVAQASGLAIGEVAALAEALKEAGGEYEDVSKVVARFYNTLEEGAKDSSSKAAESLAKVGIGIKELRTLSEGQLLAKALEELARMDAGAQRTSLAMEIFGKSFAKIDPKTLERILQTKDVNALNEELTKVSEINGNIEATFFNLQKAAISVLSALVGETDNFKISMEGAEKIVKIVGGTLAVVFSARLIATIISAVQAILFLNKALAGTAIVGQLLGKNPLFKIIGGLAVAAGIGAAAWENLSGEISDVNKEADDLIKKTSKFGDLSRGVGGAFPGATGVTEQQAKAREKEALAAQQVTEQMKLQNKEANDLRQKTIDTIGMESDRANLIKSNAQAESDSRKQIADLDAKIVAERAKGKDANAQVVVELQKQKAEVQAQLQETLRLNQAEYQRLQFNKELDRVISNQAQRIDRNQQQRISNAELEIAKQRALGKVTQEDAARQQELARLRITYEQQLAKLIADTAAASSKGDQDRVKILNDQQKALYEQYLLDQKIIQQKLEGQKLISESINAGAVDAIANIAKQFEPYKMAQDAIMIGWNSIGRAIDDFVETGKFKFKDFARSVVQDLLKMIIKAQMFQAIQATLGVFGFKIPGRAAGGPTKAGQPYIVGEKGPELFVPKSAGTVIPNNKLPNTTQATATGMVTAPITNNYITNNISAIDSKSVAQLFAENRKTLLGTVQMAQKEMPYQTR